MENIILKYAFLIITLKQKQLFHVVLFKLKIASLYEMYTKINIENSTLINNKYTWFFLNSPSILESTYYCYISVD